MIFYQPEKPKRFRLKGRKSNVNKSKRGFADRDLPVRSDIQGDRSRDEGDSGLALSCHGGKAHSGDAETDQRRNRRADVYAAEEAVTGGGKRTISDNLPDRI